MRDRYAEGMHGPYFLPLLSLTLLAGCSFAPIRVAVPDVEIPGNSSGGLICYTPTPVTESVSVGFSHADYRATATYRSSGSSPATVVVYGRTSAPEAPCVFPSEADLPLSSPLTLTPSAPSDVLVGGPDYSGTLASLITADSYYFGASLAGGVLVGTNERILLSDGEVSVYY